MSFEESTFRQIFLALKRIGTEVSPRGQLVREIEDYSYTLSGYDRFCNFAARKLNVDYIKKEFLWYLKGDRFDTSISEHASMWKGLVNNDGSINSNYGQYVFGTSRQFDRALSALLDDRDTRRASIVILNSDHLMSDTKDVPCTYSINFRIRRGKLNMSVRMRSQDAVFGMGNDAPAFSFIHEMMLCSLRWRMPELELGYYHHSADSFHIYERHFGMMDEIIDGSKFTKVDCPRILDWNEVEFMRRGDFTSIPSRFEFSRWLTTFESDNDKE